MDVQRRCNACREHGTVSFVKNRINIECGYDDVMKRRFINELPLPLGEGRGEGEVRNG